MLTLARFLTCFTTSFALVASRMALVAHALNQSMPCTSIKCQNAFMALVNSDKRLSDTAPVLKTSAPSRMGTR